MAEEKVTLLKGNEAIAHAAIRCGCDGFFGYPITPQSEIIETLSLLKPWETTGMVVLQAESEVASINMVYGGAGAGKRVFTTSSSPGIALMQEGISYMAGAGHHTAEPERLFSGYSRRRQWRLQCHCLGSRIGAGNGRLHGLGVRAGFPLPQPRDDTQRWRDRPNDGEGRPAPHKAPSH